MCFNMAVQDQDSCGEDQSKQLPTLAVWLPCTGEEHCSISDSVLLQKQAEVPLACSKGYAQSGYL